MNSLSFVGRLTRDAETRATTSGTSILSFSVANDVGFGQRKVTNFYNCTIFGKRAEGGLSQYLVKGQEVAITGEHSLRTYDKQDGTKGYSNDVNVRELTLTGGSKNNRTPENQKPPHQDDIGSDSQLEQQGSFKDDIDIPFNRIRNEYLY